MKTDTQTFTDLRTRDDNGRFKPKQIELPAPNKAQHSPLPWQIINGGLFDDSASMVFPAATKRDEANVRIIVARVNGYDKAIQALRDLTAEIKLGTLNVRKDFSLMVAHAAATKVLHESEAQ